MSENLDTIIFCFQGAWVGVYAYMHVGQECEPGPVMAPSLPHAYILDVGSFTDLLCCRPPVCGLPPSSSTLSLSSFPMITGFFGVSWSTFQFFPHIASWQIAFHFSRMAPSSHRQEGILSTCCTSALQAATPCPPPPPTSVITRSSPYS